MENGVLFSISLFASITTTVSQPDLPFSIPPFIKNASNLAAYNENGTCKPRDHNFRDECINFNAFCYGSKDLPQCKCVDDKKYDSKKATCVRHSFKTEACKTNGSSCSNANGQCTAKGECRCSTNYYAHYNTCVTNTFQPKGGCTNTTCTKRDGMCEGDGKTCLCNLDYFVEGNRCIIDSFQPADVLVIAKTSFCIKEAVCGREHGMCDKFNNKCICDPGYYAQGHMCVTRTFTPKNGCRAGDKCGGAVSPGTCTHDGKCTCNEDYFENYGVCVKAYYETEECTGKSSNTLCGQDLGRCSVVYGNGSCLCMEESWAFANTCLSAILEDDSCKSADQACSKGYGRCRENGTCRCNEGFVAQPKGASAERTCISLHHYYGVSSVPSVHCPDFWVGVLLSVANELTPSLLVDADCVFETFVHATPKSPSHLRNVDTKWCQQEAAAGAHEDLCLLLIYVSCSRVVFSLCCVYFVSRQ